MILILDGYNVIHAAAELERVLDRGLRPAREALLRFCVELLACRKDIEKIVIVFDGSSEVFYSDGSGSLSAGLDVIYTETKEEADDRILEYLGNLGRRPSVVVVSNDNYVFNNARAFGARVISVSEFCALRRHSPKKARSRTGDSAAAEISPALARDITESYKKQLGIKS